MGNPIEDAKKLQGQTKAAYDAYSDAAKGATENFVNQQNATTAGIKTALDNSIAAQEVADKSYSDIVNGWVSAAETRAKDQEKINQQQQARDKNLLMWGGIADAAAALVNLIGTTKGAVNQQRQSPQNAWSQRADALRREREQKLENYRNQLKSMQETAASKDYTIATNAAKRELDKAVTLASRSDAASQAQYQGDMAAAKAGLEGTQAGINTGLKIASMEQSERDSNRRFFKDAAAKDAEEKLKNKEFLAKWRIKGYDPETDKFRNPQTGEFDLNAPSGADKTNISKALYGIRDRIARKAGLNGFDGYLSLDKKARKKFVKDNPEADKLLQLLRNPNGLTKQDLENMNVSQMFVDASLEAGGITDEEWTIGIDADTDEQQTGANRFRNKYLTGSE